jgi:tetratricopeptide (TPR) repeat protein
MPSHIFIQLGLWDDTIASNRASIDAAAHATAASACERAGNTLHAMQFLAFALAQTGRLKEARAVVDQALAVPKTIAGADKCDEDQNVILASYVADSADWEGGKNLAVINKAPSGYGFYLQSVIGISAANRGNLQQAQEAEQTLAQIRDDIAKTSPRGKKTFAELMRLDVAGWIAEKTGRADEAIETLRSAAELEDALGGLQSGVLTMFTSAHQMYAQVLLLHQRPKSALVEFEEVLKRCPNRFNTVYGAASAADALGDNATAARYYRQLTQIAHGDERPELVIARRKLASAGKKIPSE